MIWVIVTLIVGVLPPVLDVNVLDATHQELEFVLVKYLHHVKRHQGVEAFEESVHLFFHSSHKSPFNDKSGK
jgi:hypothetical protein